MKPDKHFVSHGMTDTPIHNCWRQMLARCGNPKNAEYHNYGGRGITVCARWLQFKNFYADMGDRPEGLTLERDDVNGNYEKGNCSWKTTKQQSRNRRNTHKLMVDGELVSLAELAEKHNVKYRTAMDRWKKGKPLAEVLKPAKYNSVNR